MGRRRNNGGDIIKGIGGLLIVGALLLAGGDIRRFGDALMLILYVCLGLFALCGALVLVWFLFKRNGEKVVDEPFTDYSPRSFSPPKAVEERVSYSASLAPSIFSEELLKKLEWRRFEILVQGWFRAQG